VTKGSIFKISDRPFLYIVFDSQYSQLQENAFGSQNYAPSLWKSRCSLDLCIVMESWTSNRHIDLWAKNIKGKNINRMPSNLCLILLYLLKILINLIIAYYY